MPNHVYGIVTIYKRNGDGNGNNDDGNGNGDVDGNDGDV